VQVALYGGMNNVVYHCGMLLVGKEEASQDGTHEFAALSIIDLGAHHRREGRTQGRVVILETLGCRITVIDRNTEVPGEQTGHEALTAADAASDA
jgi:hypothetical protein